MGAGQSSQGTSEPITPVHVDGSTAILCVSDRIMLQECVIVQISYTQNNMFLYAALRPVSLSATMVNYLHEVIN